MATGVISVLTCLNIIPRGDNVCLNTFMTHNIPRIFSEKLFSFSKCPPQFLCPPYKSCGITISLRSRGLWSCFSKSNYDLSHTVIIISVVNIINKNHTAYDIIRFESFFFYQKGCFWQMGGAWRAVWGIRFSFWPHEVTLTHCNNAAKKKYYSESGNIIPSITLAGYK